jgi:serine protease AprX
MRLILFSVCLIFLSASGSFWLHAQDTLRFNRIYLKDKGTTPRTLQPDDPMYDRAVAHLTPRALQRRAKVLPKDSIVSTDDLPIVPAYLDAIRATGARIAQTSRWFNTVMVQADSVTMIAVRALPFVDSAKLQITVRRNDTKPIDKIAVGSWVVPSNDMSVLPSECITTRYGSSRVQNLQIGIDKAHRMGIAGEGILVGVLDAGFHWRTHLALRNLNVLGEYDFVFNDSNTANTPGQDNLGLNPQDHGTRVTSMIGGYWDGRVIGVAPHAAFMFAKTEDVRSERNVEEDNFIAGLEWMESQGVDVTNTSLGYTGFDPPETLHRHEDLNGQTAFGSRGVNQAVRLGVICVVAAGNQAAEPYHYIGVPAEADSAIAVAAVDSAGNITGFSSRGFGWHERIKPDVAAPGVAIAGANPAGDSLIISGQGTSFAAPIVTGAIAAILSAVPELTPYEVRTLLYRTASQADRPDTNYGYGVINVATALAVLSRTRPIIGFPSVLRHGDELSIVAGIQYNGSAISVDSRGRTHDLMLVVRDLTTGDTLISLAEQPLVGYASWQIPAKIGDRLLDGGDSIQIEFRWLPSGRLLRHAQVELSSAFAHTHSFVCAINVPSTGTFNGQPVVAPNPFGSQTLISFQLTRPAEFVDLAIFNVLGEEVAHPRTLTLLTDETPSVSFEVSFDGTGLPAGVYFYQLRVDDETFDGQMIYLPQQK